MNCDITSHHSPNAALWPESAMPQMHIRKMHLTMHHMKVFFRNLCGNGKFVSFCVFLGESWDAKRLPVAVVFRFSKGSPTWYPKPDQTFLSMDGNGEAPIFHFQDMVYHHPICSKPFQVPGIHKNVVCPNYTTWKVQQSSKYLVSNDAQTPPQKVLRGSKHGCKMTMFEITT